MHPVEYFLKQLESDPYYVADERCFEPFWNFMYRFQSLQRHWDLSKTNIKAHMSLLREAEGDSSEGFAEMYAETASVDIEYFPEYLRLSTISFSLSLVENLLGDLGEEVAEDLGVKIDLDKRPLPYINKYILWLTRGCNIAIEIDKDLWKSLDAIRELRNRFIHKIDRDIPAKIKATMSEMVLSTFSDEHPITDEFVDISFKKLAKLVKIIELAYIEFYEKQHG